jgi:hypothetical protein
LFAQARNLNTTQVLLLALIALVAAWAVTDLYLRIDRIARHDHAVACARFKLGPDCIIN